MDLASRHPGGMSRVSVLPRCRLIGYSIPKLPDSLRTRRTPAPFVRAELQVKDRGRFRSIDETDDQSQTHPANHNYEPTDRVSCFVSLIFSPRDSFCCPCASAGPYRVLTTTPPPGRSDGDFARSQRRRGRDPGQAPIQYVRIRYAFVRLLAEPCSVCQQPNAPPLWVPSSVSSC